MVNYKAELEYFLEHRNKELALKYAKKVAHDPVFMDYIVNESLVNNGQKSRYAVWIIDKLLLVNKKLVTPYLERIVSFIPLCTDRTQLGILLRIGYRAEINLEVENLGLLIDKCVEILRDPKPPQYHKGYSLNILFKIAQMEPFFKDELRLLIEEILPHFKAPYMIGMAKGMLKELE